ncbi:MAG: glycosyltransferase family 4 protein [Candidatus Eisenbacteria bacterium]
MGTLPGPGRPADYCGQITMARILIIKPLLPYPPDQGTKVVTFNLLKLLSRHFEVSLLCGLASKEDASKAEGLKPFCKEVFTFLLPNKKSRLHSFYYKGKYSLQSSLTGFPLETFYCASPLLRRTVAEVTRSSKYEMAQFEYWFTADAARLAEVPCKVLLEHDIDFLRHERRLASTAGFWPRRSAKRTIASVRAREVRAYSEFDMVFALSRSDGTLVERLAGIRGICRYLPVVIDCEKYSPSAEEKIPASIVFLGALDADFNIDAILFFCREIFPLVLNGVPEARLFIVGRRPPAAVQKLADGERVILSANVEDITSHVRRCMVQVVPLRFGGGVRVRTLEGMAMGMAIVSSSVGMDGILARPGRDLLRADSPREFAGRVCEILRNPYLAAKLGERARHFVVTHHSEEVLERNVLNTYAEALRQAELRRKMQAERESQHPGQAGK